MGGGDILKSNLIFNMVRETQDHGTFNSWDRQPFYNATGTGYTYPYREIYNNFWINNFNPQEATDNGAWGQTFTEAVDVINDLHEQC